MGTCVCVPTFNEIFSLGWVALAYNMYLLVTFQQFSKGKHALFIIMEELTWRLTCRDSKYTFMYELMANGWTPIEHTQQS